MPCPATSPKPDPNPKRRRYKPFPPKPNLTESANPNYKTQQKPSFPKTLHQNLTKLPSFSIISLPPKTPKLSTMKPSSLFFTLTTLLLLLSNPNLSSSSSSDNDEEFEAWCKKYDKSYPSEQERLYRLGVFQENLAYITHHNDLGNSTYTLALNAFADLTHREFKASRLGGVLLPSSIVGRKKRDPKPSEVVDVPSEIDWRRSGAVTCVKDEGNCAIFLSVFQSLNLYYSTSVTFSFIKYIVFLVNC